jgi:hypothetical protein
MSPIPQNELTTDLPPRFADFGESIASVDIDEWVLATLELWMPTYLAWIKQDKGLPYDIALPKRYANVIEDLEWPDYALPAILVATAKTDGTPDVLGDGSYSVNWLVAVSAIIRGQNPAMSRSLASYTELAVRMVLLQHGTLGGYARSTRWTGLAQTRPVSDPTGNGRFLGEGTSTFIVSTDEAVYWNRGPLIPYEGAYEDLPEVESITIEAGGETAVVDTDD